MGASVSYTPGKGAVAKNGVGDTLQYAAAYGTPASRNTAASWSKGKTTSDYASVTKQAGIYAGDGGYQIKVQDNTHLIGAVIASTAEADKNSLITGTLTMDNIRNKASYSTGDTGISYRHYGTKKEHDNDYNNTGLLPNLSAGAKNDAASTTKSAISQGTITATKEHLDVNVINRNTQDSLNKLGKIFDKKKVEERQELAQLFAKNADGLLHYYDRDGKFDKVAAHGIVAEITSQIAGNKAGNGFISGAANEALINKIKVWSHGDPAKAQWISAALGATVNGVIGKSSHTGSAVAQYGTKWNELAQYTELTQNNTGAGDDTYDANTGEWTQDEDNSDIDKNESNSNDDGSNVEPTNDTSEGALGKYISSANQNQDVFSEENSGPVVIAKGYQASDGAELEYLSDGTIQPTGKYIKNDDSLDNTKTTDTSNSFLNNLENSAISSGGHALFVKGVEEGTVIATSYNPSISIQDAVTFGKSLGGKAVIAIQGIEYVQQVKGNHQQFENGYTALQADVLDAAPIATDIGGGSVMGLFTANPVVVYGAGVLASSVVKTKTDEMKENLKEQEEEEKQKKGMNPKQ